ncbi:LysM domain-containing protein [Alicyclobacillaceae bacterium I2511]|nr:LysM domain-containing protein [Alicyclobacillaceae bacterium I2511]
MWVDTGPICVWVHIVAKAIVDLCTMLHHREVHALRKYIVQQGDTLSGISQTTGVRLPLLLAANPQLNNLEVLHPGEVLVIPELDKPKPAQQGMAVQMSNPPPGQSHKNDVTAPEGGAENVGTPTFFGFVWPHVVKPGETWETLEQSYTTSLATLLQLNPGKQGRPLTPGEVVYVPGMSGNPPAPGGMPDTFTGLKKDGGVGNPQGPHTHFPYRAKSGRGNSVPLAVPWDFFAQPVLWQALPWAYRGIGWQYGGESSLWESDWLESGSEYVGFTEDQRFTQSPDAPESP